MNPPQAQKGTAAASLAVALTQFELRDEDGNIYVVYLKPAVVEKLSLDSAAQFRMLTNLKKAGRKPDIIGTDIEEVTVEDSHQDPTWEAGNLDTSIDDDIDLRSPAKKKQKRVQRSLEASFKTSLSFHDDSSEVVILKEPRNIVGMSYLPSQFSEYDFKLSVTSAMQEAGVEGEVNDITNYDPLTATCDVELSSTSAALKLSQQEYIMHNDTAVYPSAAYNVRALKVPQQLLNDALKPRVTLLVSKTNSVVVSNLPMSFVEAHFIDEVAEELDIEPDAITVKDYSKKDRSCILEFPTVAIASTFAGKTTFQYGRHLLDLAQNMKSGCVTGMASDKSRSCATAYVSVKNLPHRFHEAHFIGEVAEELDIEPDAVTVTEYNEENRCCTLEFPTVDIASTFAGKTPFQYGKHLLDVAQKSKTVDVCTEMASDEGHSRATAHVSVSNLPLRFHEAHFIEEVAEELHIETDAITLKEHKKEDRSCILEVMFPTVDIASAFAAKTPFQYGKHQLDLAQNLESLERLTEMTCDEGCDSATAHVSVKNLPHRFYEAHFIGEVAEELDIEPDAITVTEYNKENRSCTLEFPTVDIASTFAGKTPFQYGKHLLDLAQNMKSGYFTGMAPDKSHSFHVSVKNLPHRFHEAHFISDVADEVNIEADAVQLKEYSKEGRSCILQFPSVEIASSFVSKTPFKYCNCQLQILHVNVETLPSESDADETAGFSDVPPDVVYRTDWPKYESLVFLKYCIENRKQIRSRKTQDIGIGKGKVLAAMNKNKLYYSKANQKKRLQSLLTAHDVNDPYWAKFVDEFLDKAPEGSTGIHEELVRLKALAESQPVKQNPKAAKTGKKGNSAAISTVTMDGTVVQDSNPGKHGDGKKRSPKQVSPFSSNATFKERKLVQLSALKDNLTEMTNAVKMLVSPEQ